MCFGVAYTRSLTLWSSCLVWLGVLCLYENVNTVWLVKLDVLVGARMELEVIRTPVDDSRRTWCLWKWLNSRLA